MAEGWVNYLLGDSWEAFSAGTRPADQVHPMAVRVMSEAGVDISGGRAEHVDRYLREAWDLVVTVCDSALDECPHFPGQVAKRHMSFKDPARATGDDAEREAAFREVSGEIRERLVPEIARIGGGE